MRRVDLVQVVHPVHAGGEEAGIAQCGKDGCARRRDGDFAGELHDASLARCARPTRNTDGRYCVGILAALASDTVASTSFLKNVANSASDIGIGSMPSAANRA